ncbi:hypothetical protein [Aureivirga marina]|uniref:hypothetical protein n=1 Tax=Aureivirga marina TaxID=1182451 RepID=UPI0018CB4CC3|nr:hypothetical protein [Aureivirga marina]
MLKLSEIKEYVGEFAALISNSTKVIHVVDDKDFANHTKDISDEDHEFILVNVIPDFHAISNDIDSMRLMPRIQFYIVQKTSSKAGNEKEMEILEQTQNAVEKIVNQMMADIEKGNTCSFKVALSTINTEPVKNYHQTTGWVLSFELI